MDINKIILIWDEINKAKKGVKLSAILKSSDLEHGQIMELVAYLGEDLEEIRAYWETYDFYKVITKRFGT